MHAANIDQSFHFLLPFHYYFCMSSHDAGAQATAWKCKIAFSTGAEKKRIRDLPLRYTLWLGSYNISFFSADIHWPDVMPHNRTHPHRVGKQWAFFPQESFFLPLWRSISLGLEIRTCRANLLGKKFFLFCLDRLRYSRKYVINIFWQSFSILLSTRSKFSVNIFHIRSEWKKNETKDKYSIGYRVKFM